MKDLMKGNLTKSSRTKTIRDGGKSTGSESLETLKEGYFKLGRLLTRFLTKQDLKDLVSTSVTPTTLQHLCLYITSTEDTSWTKLYFKKVYQTNSSRTSFSTKKRLSLSATQQNPNL